MRAAKLSLIRSKFLNVVYHDKRREKLKKTIKHSGIKIGSLPRRNWILSGLISPLNNLPLMERCLQALVPERFCQDTSLAEAALVYRFKIR
jgi:hypothetical protein